MKNIVQSLILIFVIAFLWSCSSSKPSDPLSFNQSGSAKPKWLVEHPIDPNYYIGIGSASITKYGSDAQKSSQDLALADLASQITVTISSDIVTTLIERGAMTEEEYLATARSQAVADLEGHEFVDSWQDQYYHYAYYRLSKAKYAAIQAKKREAAISLATDFLLKGQKATQSGDFSNAMNAGVQAFIPLIPYLNEALESQVNGESVILSNEVNQFLNTLLVDIKITPNKANVSGKLGKGLGQKLIIHASHTDGKKIINLPLRLRFKKGGGELKESIITDGNGSAALVVRTITSGEKLQILEVSLDMDKMLPQGASPILSGILNSIPKTTTEIAIDVSNPTIYLSSVERFDGQNMDQAQIEPKMKNHFIDSGFHFVDQASRADWQMTLRATATRGTEYSGMYTVFADVSLSVVDSESEKEIYKNSLSRVKGIDLNYLSAANKALTNAANQLNANILPQIMESLK